MDINYFQKILKPILYYLHQNTATQSFSLRTFSNCLAVTSSITGSECFVEGLDLLDSDFEGAVALSFLANTKVPEFKVKNIKMVRNAKNMVRFFQHNDTDIGQWKAEWKTQISAQKNTEFLIKHYDFFFEFDTKILHSRN